MNVAMLPRVRRIAVLLAVGVLLSGQSGGGCDGAQSTRPAISLEQARQVAVQIENSPFVAPPRTVEDVAAILDRQKPDPAKALELQKAADAAIPSGLSAQEGVNALVKRAEAAFEVGRIRQVFVDGEEALRLARSRGLDPTRILVLLRTTETLTGRFGNLVRYSEELIQLSRTRGRLGDAFSPMGLLAYNLASAGDFAGASRYLGQAENLLKESKTWDGGRSYFQYGGAWESSVQAGRAGVAGFSGNFE
ncbi:MAG: hypothetical protein HY246_11080, partial [Proteobacteria bacterium]|nr:hypothetical protein [Pseudomonadota bacterium]